MATATTTSTSTTTTTSNPVVAEALAIAATATPPVPAPAPTTSTPSQPAGRAKAQQTAMATRKMENSSGREYKYFTEISQMMFVFGEVQDPMPETVNLVEDIVRSQIIELVRFWFYFTRIVPLGRGANVTRVAGVDFAGS